MSESMQLFRESTHRVRMNAKYSQKQMRLLAASLSHLNMYNRGDLLFAYSTYDGSGDQRKLMRSGHYVRVKDRAGNLLGVELSEDVGIPMAIMHVRMGHCPANLAMDPRNTIDPITGKQLIGGGGDEKEQVCPAMTRTCETGYTYRPSRPAVTPVPAAKPKQVEPSPQVVTPRQQTELRLCGLSEAEVTLLIDKNAKQQVDIDKLRKLVGKLRVSHSLVGDFRKRIVELTEQVDTFEVSEGQLVGKLENAEEELQDMARAYANGNALRAVEFEQKLKAKEQELVDINREAYATDACLQAILREFPSIKLPKKARIDAAMVEYINTQDALDLEELARKHSITLSELQTAAADLKSKPAAKPTRKRKLATAN